MVTILVSDLFNSDKKVYKVVDLPEPVGPVIRIMPLDIDKS